ncbi:anthranilate phosphoribosyltransferase [Actinomycetospora sp. Odt1-22]|uniref:Anthranilate phosphoribosyltransferase n=1 Tax=Actinomycetospora termitidis TaxID=3053470 RepID=A0ABT7M845_9PSEU|nr:anthranilate phosphoribosyltransferase [Actinomycetospora sp. Odt1-22]MDL5156841.1 anthranilate phosphoribosyltransferase [Actinomycetospora sp. Odt1-22]
MSAAEPAAPPTWAGLLGRLLRGEDLGGPEAAWAMDRMMSGEASPAQVGAFVVALRSKGETAAEIGGLAEVMRAHARAVEVDGVVVDIVGTGGDQAHTVNISTMSAVVMAAAGARVVKHGGRAASSACGSVDLLEALGVPIDLGPEAVAASVAEVGIGFCFAQTFHPAMRHVGGVRREIGVPTAFNLLGPLTNPARPAAALIGCADARFAPLLAEVLADRGDTALVVRGDDGLDEITTTTTTTVWRAGPAGVTRETLDPTRIGVPVSVPGDLRGGDAAVNAAAARTLFAGEHGPVREAVLLNAGAALAAYDEALGHGRPDLHDAVAAGRDRAAAAVDDGSAAALLERWAATAARLRG